MTTLPELARMALILALGAALAGGAVSLIGAQRGRCDWMAWSRPLAGLLAALVMLACAGLGWAFVQNDFSLRYVAEHSHRLLPWAYRVAAVWSGHEGSLLLWLMLQTGWMLAFSLRSGTLPEALRARVIGIQMLVAAAFLLFLLLTANPFERLLPAADEGFGLNPLLQDPGLALHPPLLYMGYAGFSVVFAFAVAVLLSGRLDADWARCSRPWTLAAWIFLTLGIVLGSVWAYHVLGWGGWWFWDPVENASLMPWLVATALLHSLALSSRRGSFMGWSLLLAIAAFSLSLLGTFLVRSGVLISVHAFASDPRRGLFILVFLALLAGTALALLVWRAPRIASGGRFAAVSRESLLLACSMLLVVACATVLLGTLYPLLLDVLGLGRISVGPPYFTTVLVPLMAPLPLLIGIAPFVRWRRTAPEKLFRQLRWALVSALLSAVILPLVHGRWAPLLVLGVSLASWIGATVLLHVFPGLRALRGARGEAARFWGMHLAHLGVAVFVVGVTAVSFFQDEQDFRLAAGETVNVAGYAFRFNGVTPVEGANYLALRGDFELFADGLALGRLFPEKRRYLASAMPMSEAAIDRNLLRDVYVSLGEPVERSQPLGDWVVRIHYKPLVSWIWGGCLLMALGGLLALFGRDRPGSGQRQGVAA